ncbi:MAG: glycosyltransferase family 4 protein [Bacillota bacterium]
MNIAFVSRYLPSNSKAGVGYQAHRLAETLTKRGHRVTVFSQGPRPDASYGFVSLRTPGSNHLAEPAAFALAVASVDFAPYDVVHYHGDNQYVNADTPSVRTFYGTAVWEARFSDNQAYSLLQASNYAMEFLSGMRSDINVAISESTRHALPFVDMVIPVGVDVSLFTPGAKSKTPSILFVGTLKGRKRGSLLLQTFLREVLPSHPSARLMMVGVEYVGQHGVTAIRRASDQQLAELYRLAWIYCSCSSYEGFGVPYLEAMASGTPCVSTPNAGAKEVLPGVGAIVHERDLGKVLCSLINDDKKRFDMAAAGLARVREYRFENIAARYEAAYERARRGGNGRRAARIRFSDMVETMYGVICQGR